MPLDADVPEPPTLQTGLDAAEYDDTTVAEAADDYRRDELQRFLGEGAWRRAWERWAETTELTAEEYEVIRDLGLIQRFDFFWDDFAGRVGYHAPGIPEDWRERGIHDSLSSWGAVSSINASLTELGQIVCDVLAEDYIDWEASFEAPDDLPDFG